MDNSKPTLFDAILALGTYEECRKFFDDLLTPKELQSFIKRWEAFLLLEEGITQREVASNLRISVATVSRVNKTLCFGNGGYKMIVRKIDEIKSIDH